MFAVMGAVAVLLLAPQGAAAKQLGIAIVGEAKGAMKLYGPVGGKGEGLRRLGLGHAYGHFTAPARPAGRICHIEHGGRVIEVGAGLLQAHQGKPSVVLFRR